MYKKRCFNCILKGQFTQNILSLTPIGDMNILVVCVFGFRLKRAVTPNPLQTNGQFIVAGKSSKNMTFE